MLFCNLGVLLENFKCLLFCCVQMVWMVIIVGGWNLLQVWLFYVLDVFFWVVGGFVVGLVGVYGEIKCLGEVCSSLFMK